jgi:hypothetical protein
VDRKRAADEKKEVARRGGKKPPKQQANLRKHLANKTAKTNDEDTSVRSEEEDFSEDEPSTTSKAKTIANFVEAPRAKAGTKVVEDAEFVEDSSKGRKGVNIIHLSPMRIFVHKCAFFACMIIYFAH